MTRFEVVTWDAGTGVAVIDHVWKVARHHGKRKMRKLTKRVNRWANREAKADKSSDHVVYVRSI